MESKDLKQTKTMGAAGRVAGKGNENAYSTHGAQLLVATDTDGVDFKAVAHLVTVTPPATETDEIDTTDHDSKGWKQSIAGLKDGGEMPFTINVTDKENVEMLFELDASKDVVKWKIEVPTKDPIEYSFDGFLKDFDINELPSTPEAITADGNIKISGEVKKGYTSAA